MKFQVILLILVNLWLTSCNKPGRPAEPDHALVTDNSGALLLADTITYDVIISNPNPDDTWTTKCLSRLNRRAMIDSIFSMIYQEKAIAYNFETREKLTVKQLKRMESEPGFSRDLIGMIQFTEAWYLDPASAAMTKKVISMILGYNFYASDGELFGHKPVFKVYLNIGNL